MASKTSVHTKIYESVSSRIWTRVAVYISYDDNQYTTGTSGNIIILSVSSDNFLHAILEVAQQQMWNYSSYLYDGIFF